MSLCLLLRCSLSLACLHAGEHRGDDHATSDRRFDDVERWTQVFDSPERDAWQRPEELVRLLELQPGQVIADIGAGTGYLSPHLAAAVGKSGRVLAVDVEPSLVEHMRARALEEGTPQVEARLGEPSDPGLRQGEVHQLLFLDAYHHVSDRVSYFTRLQGTLQAEGWLTVVDWATDRDCGQGPAQDHRLPREQVVDELQRAGWTLRAESEELPCQYLLRFQRS